MRNVMLSIVSAVVLSSAPAWAQIAATPADQFADVCLGDLNGDGVVNSADLASILGSYGICRGCDEDLNHDGYVDETDVKILALHWGPCASDEDVITKFVRTLADVSDDPEIYEDDVATNDQERESDTRKLRFTMAAASDQPEIDEGDVATNDQERESGARKLRFTTAAASDQPEIYEADDATNNQERESDTRKLRFTTAAAPEQSEIFEGDVGAGRQVTCEGDLDRNGQIDSTDLAMLLGKYGRCSRRCEEDLNGDGVVGEEDVDILLDSWGKCQEEEEKSTAVSRSLAATDGAEIEADLPPQIAPEEEEPQCPGDLDGNGTIDSTDLALLLSSYGRCYKCEADLTGDGSVDQDDIDVLMASWGECDEETPRDSSPKGKSHAVSLSGG